MQNEINETRQALFIDKQPENALSLANQLRRAHPEMPVPELRAVTELAGLAAIQCRQYDDATDLFLLIDDTYQAGYAQMLKGDLNRAITYWRRAITTRPN